jgi:hypothetical protein
MIVPLIFAAILLILSYNYLQIQNDLILVLIPLLSLLSLRFKSKLFKASLVGLFILFFFLSSFLLYINSKHYDYEPFGVLTYIFFATIVIVTLVEHRGEGND